ncbi:hypothetical protein JIQ42_07812 [Leishmania sp. Namibia]|uniref:hypothetical protein n=1 Tax=Leishmania sp. Namibia TaxID=2802991 RepID=UPI001B42AD5D|nr:hypothetical protein JIQ42_07812 [Leishmania sp. Namibia]
MPSHSRENSPGNSVADAKSFDGRPASCSLSLSSPVRPQVPSRGAASSSEVSKAGKGACLSTAARKDRGRAGAGRSGRGGGGATMFTSVNELHRTQRGFVIPPAQGVPPHGGLPPETRIEHAKVKCRRAPHQLRVAARGAFSNVTSFAILQRVSSLQLNARQVEPAGWAPIEPSPMSASTFDGDGDAEEKESMSQMRRRAAGLDREESSTGTTPRGTRDSAMRSPSASSRAFSSASRIPLDAMMVAESWREDAAAPSAAQATQHGKRKTNKAHAQAVTPSTSPPTRSCDGGNPEGDDEQQRQHRRAVAAIESVPHSNSREDVARCAAHKVTSTEGSPAGSLSPATLQHPPSPDHPAAATARSSRRSSASMPRGFERFMERGKRRRAEAERARLARVTEAAGELLFAASEHGRIKGDGATKRPRKVPMVPLPRGCEGYAQEEQSRRVEANRKEGERRTDGIVTCTHHPPANRPSIVSASASGGAWAQTPALHPTPRVAAAAGEERAAAAERPSLSVFERLATKREQHDYRPRQVEEHHTPSLQPHISTLATAAPASPSSLKPKAHRSSAASPGTPAVALEKAGAGAPTAGDAPAKATAPKKSQAEVEQHLARMRSREEEGRIKRERNFKAQAGEGEEVPHGRVVVNPKTDELAERARARYRMQEMAKQQRAYDEAQRAVTAHKAQRRPANRRWAHPSPNPVKRSEHVAHVPRRGAEPTSTAARVAAEKAAADDFYAHQLQAEGRKQRYLEQLRLQHAEAELSECTFRPRLNGTSERMAQRLVVESFPEDHAGSAHSRLALAAAPSEEVAVDQSTGSVPPLAEYCGTHGLSPLARAGSGSLFRELNRASPLAHCYVPSPSGSRPRLVERGVDGGIGMAFNDDCSHGSIESRSYDGRAVEAPGGEAMALPGRLSAPLVEQLQSLEEMLREWKAIERACSPMRKHYCRGSIGE